MDLTRDELAKKVSQISPSFRKVRLYFLLFFTLTMPMVIYLGNTEYGYTKTIYTYVYISFLLLLWLGELLVKKDKRVALTELSVPVGLLLLSGLLSLFNAPSKGVVLQSLALLVYFFLIYLLVSNTIKTRSEAEYLLVALITSGVGATIYGTLQFYGLARGAHGFSSGAGNIISVMGNQNYLGGFISYLFIPAFALVLVSGSKIIKFYLSLSLGLFFFLLFPIGSRGSWLALAIGGLVFLSTLVFFRPLTKLTSRNLYLASVLVLAILIAVYFLAPTPNILQFDFGLSSSGKANTPFSWISGFFERLEQELVEEGGARLEDWNIGMEMFREHPILGIGLGNYKIKFLDYRAELLNSEKGDEFGGHIPRGAQAHNEYVQFLAELGVFGVIAILVGLVILLLNVFRRVSGVGPGSSQLIGLSLIAGLVGFLIHSTVSFPGHLPASSFAFVTFLGLINSGVYDGLDYEFKPSGYLRYFVFALIAVFVVTVSVFAYRDWRANVLRGQGETQMDYGNFRLAKEKFLQSIKLDFQPRQTYYHLGLAERQLGNSKSALDYFEKSKGQFEPYGLFLQLGTLYMDQDKLDKAKGNLNELVSMDPRKDLKIDANYYLAVIATQQGNVDEASERLKSLLKKDPDFERAIILQGDIATYRGNEEKAKKELNRALEIINQKLDNIEERLSGDISMSSYGEIKARREALEERKNMVTDRLKEL